MVNRSLTAVAVQSLILRGAAYALQGAAALLFSGIVFLLLSSTLYALSSGVAYGLDYTASNTMIFNSLKGKKPRLLTGRLQRPRGCIDDSGVQSYPASPLTWVPRGRFRSSRAILGLTAWITSRLPRGNPEQGTNT